MNIVMNGLIRSDNRMSVKFYIYRGVWFGLDIQSILKNPVGYFLKAILINKTIHT